MRTSSSAPDDSPGSRSTPSQCCRRRFAVSYMTSRLAGLRVEFADGRQGHPFADHRHVSAAVDGRGCRFETAQVAGDQVGVAAGAGSVGAGDEDELRFHVGECIVNRAQSCNSRKEHGCSAEQRKTHLLALLERDGRVVAKEVAVELAMSEDSIRRDLRELADAGLARRVYGGALPVEASEPPFADRTGVEPVSKARVARAALALVEPGMTIALDAGTTSLALARILAARRPAHRRDPEPARRDRRRRALGRPRDPARR